MSRKDPEKAEDFVGWVSPDGLLKVVELTEKSKHSKYKVICDICSQDHEMFPKGYFISTKSNLKKGKKPCGCSKQPKLDKEQLILKTTRAADSRGFTIQNIVGEFNKVRTRVSCKCLIEGHEWVTEIRHILHKNTSCPLCAVNSRRNTQDYALKNCEIICSGMGYISLGFPKGYKTHKSIFEYECKIHGIQRVSYNNFVSGRVRCKSCANFGYDPNKQGSFYLVRWVKNEDSFIKFGITNKPVLTRINQQSKKTEYRYHILFQQTWEDGHIALNLERAIKNTKKINIGVIDKLEFKDGYTETLSEINLPLLLLTINENLIEQQA